MDGKNREFMYNEILKGAKTKKVSGKGARKKAMSSKQVRTSYKSGRIGKVALGCAGILLFLLLIAYLSIAQYYKSHFYTKTYINGMDCSNLTAEEAKEVITNQVKAYTLNVIARDGSTGKITGKEIELECSLDRELSDVLEEQSAYAWLGNALQDKKIDNPYTLSFNQDKLKELVGTLDCLKEDKQVEPTDAKISDYQEGKGFSIIQEEQGNKLIQKNVEKAVANAVNSLADEVSLDDFDCYKKPKVTSTSPKITKAMQQIDKYMKTKITYKFGDKTEVLDDKVIGPAITITKKNKVKINQEKIAEYIAGLAKKYNTYGGDWKFKTSGGANITVSGGDYGWKLGQTTELKEVMELINAGKQQEKKPASALETMEYGNYEIGSTYVEVNVTEQHMYFYKNGKLIVDSRVVTGIPRNGHSTPSGVYYVKWKTRDRYLRGNNDDGTKYKTLVHYWMPFTDSGIGLHDAWWRGAFGGSIYTYNGSHGCVNLPSGVAAKLYANIPVNTPVVVYR